MNQSKTKKALLISGLVILLCSALFVGATYAWFTSTASASVNKIVTGKLEVLLVDGTGASLTKPLAFVVAEGGEAATEVETTAEGGTVTYILWEPGATFRTEEFYVKNNGNLALKFKLSVNDAELSGIKLSEVLEFTILYEGEEYSSSEEIQLLKQTTSQAFTIQVHMKEDANNDYQELELEGITVTVVATQLNSEYDSNGNIYDKDATYDTETESATETEAQP